MFERRGGLAEAVGQGRRWDYVLQEIDGLRTGNGRCFYCDWNGSWNVECGDIVNDFVG